MKPAISKTLFAAFGVIALFVGFAVLSLGMQINHAREDLDGFSNRALDRVNMLDRIRSAGLRTVGASVEITFLILLQRQQRPNSKKGELVDEIREEHEEREQAVAEHDRILQQAIDQKDPFSTDPQSLHEIPDAFRRLVVHTDTLIRLAADDATPAVLTEAKARTERSERAYLELLDSARDREKQAFQGQIAAARNQFSHVTVVLWAGFAVMVGTILIVGFVTKRQIGDPLRKTETMLRLAAEAAPVYMAYIDKDGFTRFGNQAFASRYGYAPDEIIGKHRHEYWTEEQISENEESIAKVLSGEATRKEVARLHADGLMHHQITTRTPHIDDQGNVVGYLSVAMDITDQKAAEKQLRQIQKMESLGTMAGGVAHELNNILLPIQGLTELAIEDLPEGSAMRRNLQLVVRNARRAGDLVGKILAFSRQEEAEITEFDLRDVVEEQMSLSRSALPATIDITQDLGDAPLPVRADATQIHQVVMNLASNAADAMGTRVGRLEIRLTAVPVYGNSECRRLRIDAGDYARMSVSDTGQGMTTGVRERTFEPFFTTKEVGSGTGLGLSIIHGIVENLHGAIDVTSEVGRGTTIDIYLPLAEPGEPARAIAAAG